MKISIIGAAGIIGSATAYTLIERDMIDELVLLDPNVNMLKSHAIDLQFCQVYHPGCKVRWGDYNDVDSSDEVIICASISPNSPDIKSRLDYLEANKKIFGSIILNLAELNDIGVIITASNPADVLNYLVYKKGKWTRQQVIGFTSNDAARLQYYTALEKNLSPNDVKGALNVGEHGALQLPLFKNIELPGEERLTPAEVEAVRTRLDNFYSEWRGLGSGRTLGWLSAQGIVHLVECIISDTPSVVPCSVCLDGEFGLHGLSIGVPALLGSGKMLQVAENLMAEDDIKRLLGVADQLSPFMRNVE